MKNIFRDMLKRKSPEAVEALAMDSAAAKPNALKNKKIRKFIWKRK